MQGCGPGAFHLTVWLLSTRIMSSPWEAVAYGAAVQAAIVSGQGHEDVQNMLLVLKVWRVCDSGCCTGEGTLEGSMSQWI